MKMGSNVRRIILMGTIVLVLILAWISISGAISQYSRSQTIGQIAETVIQIVCGLLSALIVLTCFYLQKLRRPVRFAWLISLVITTGLSSVVWGPPMLIVGVISGVITYLVARGIIWLLQVGGA